ncbi:MAG: RluA family pseudouridine synthase [Betaproteobacteria bacterium]
MAPGPSEPPQVSLLTVDADWAGQRLDNFLLRLLKGVPKTHIYRIIRSGEVRINKARASADTRLEAGDQLRLPPVRTSARAELKAREIIRHGAMSSTGVAAPARQFVLLREDEHLLAIDKPAGVAVHGGSGVAFGVIEQLRMARPAEKFLELVHRLDRETSGVLLVAKKRMALKQLQEQFRERDTDKVYLALVQGHWPERLKVLDQYLLKVTRDDGERRVSIVDKDHPQAMRALSLVKVERRLNLAGVGELSLLQVTIRTGRTHQIRVHLAGAGHAIVGDDKYGDFELNRRLQKMPAPATLARMFLHAWQLKFNHPADGRRIALQAVLPAELQQFIDHASPQL